MNATPEKNSSRAHFCPKMNAGIIQGLFSPVNYPSVTSPPAYSEICPATSSVATPEIYSVTSSEISW
jgi:hypothetical protein